MKPLWFLMIVFMPALLGVSAISCHEEEEMSQCDSYCYEMADCYQTLDQPFSRSACVRDCEDSLERYTSVGCRTRYYDLLECKTDISCRDANEVSDVCSREIDDLTNCVE